MKPIVMLCCLFALLPQRQCNMGSPEMLKGQIEDNLREYFPNVRGMVSIQSQSVIALTCTQNVGLGFVTKLATMLSNDPDTAKKLGWLQLAGTLHGNHYRYFRLVFDSSMIQYDIDGRQILTYPLTPQMLANYQRDCGFSSQ